MTLPHSFSWTYGWYVRADGKDCYKIGNDMYFQDFSFKYDGIETGKESPTSALKNIKVSIIKFGCPSSAAQQATPCMPILPPIHKLLFLAS